MKQWAALLAGVMLSSTACAQQPPRHHLPFVYYLQNLDKAKLEEVNPAVAVVDPYDTRLTPLDIADLQGRMQQKLYAYISAGEADPSRKEPDDGYRFREEWHKAPWIVNVPKKAQNNERWATKRVEYWHPEWMELMRERAREAARRGYTGVMLDTVDTFGAYAGLYPKRDVVADMACLVAAVGKAGREVKPDFKVLINGGMELYDSKCPSEQGDFLASIDGQLKEDTWYNEKGSAKAAWTKDDLGYLKRALDAGKPVYSIDYFTDEKVTHPNANRMKDYTKQAAAFGVIAFAADRSLGKYLDYNTTYYADDAAWANAQKYGIKP